MDADARSDLATVFLRLGDKLEHVHAVGSGSGSRVFTCHGRKVQAVLRLAQGRRGHCDPSAERMIRDRLSALGVPVGRTLASAVDHPGLFGGAEWMLDARLSGTHPQRWAIPAEALRGLGAALAALHEIEADGWGPLVRMDGEVATGCSATPVAGLGRRFDLPLNAEDAEALEGRIRAVDRALAPVVSRVVAWLHDLSVSGQVLCHTDLHERNILVADGRLTGLIDFGDMTVAPPAWDLGSIRYFHGSEALATALEGYASDDVALAEDAVRASAAIALHHAARSRLPGKHHRLVVAVDYLGRLHRAGSI